MFSCLVAGKWVNTNCRQVDQTKFVIDLGEADKFNHIVVFMTGAALLPNGFIARIFLNWPADNAPNWIHLGTISNEKPSAFFKVTSSSNHSNDGQSFSHASTSIRKEIGISIEPAAQEPTTSSINTYAAQGSSTAVQLIKNIITNFVNFASSFAFCPNPDLPSVTFIPTKVVNEWLTKTMHKLANDPEYFSKE